MFDSAKSVGLRTVYVLTDEKPANWEGQLGFINPEMIKDEIKDWAERTFHVSGPEPMVEAFEKMLATMGIADNRIKRDFFPGYTDTHSR